MLTFNWLEETLSKDKSTLDTANFKALNATFASIDANQFKLISSCECARDAWTILQMAHEGSPYQNLQVENACLQILGSKDDGE